MIDAGGVVKAAGTTSEVIIEKVAEHAPEIMAGVLEAGKKLFKKKNVGDNENSIDKETSYNEKTDNQDIQPSNNSSITEEMLLKVIDEIRKGNSAILEAMSENRALTDEIKKANEITTKEMYESLEKAQNENLKKLLSENSSAFSELKGNYSIIKSKINKLEKIICISVGISLVSLIVSIFAMVL